MWRWDDNTVERVISQWQHIQYSDGSNPYICKTEEEFQRLQKKYGCALEKIKNGFWLVNMNRIRDKVNEIIKENYNFDEATIQKATQDIVDRCFWVTGVPSEDELFDYVKGYLSR